MPYFSNLRKSLRVPVEMHLRSSSLPLYQASVVDLSNNGARLQLRGAVSQALENQRIRFGASLPGQKEPYFEGLARVAWIRQSEAGWEAGLEWERLTPSQWSVLSTIVETLAA